MIKVFGHPRSGTHFIAAVIAQNFFNEKDYLKYYSKRSPHMMGSGAKKIKDSKIVYIKRNFEDVAKSIFKIKDRFGLDVPDFETFLNTKYSDMWVPHLDFTIKVNNRLKTSYRKDVSSRFRRVTMTPKKYWNAHVSSWTNQKGVVIVDYDYFKKDFDAALTDLSKQLKLEIQTFDRLKEKVGWMPV